MTSLLPQFSSTGLTLLSFVVALMVIVFVHEMGHYLAGRWSGIKADVFSIGFGPVLWRRVDRRGTVWQIALVPLGGYVKFKGDSNAASMGADTGAKTFGHALERLHCLRQPMKHAHAESGVIVGGKHHRLLR